MYKVSFRASAKKEFVRLPAGLKRQLAVTIDALAQDPRPHGVRKLSGADAWRLRRGDFRIIYTIEDKKLVIEIIKIGNRRDVYR